MKFTHFIIACALGSSVCACTSSEYRRTEGAAWGTTYHITYEADRDLSDSVVATMRSVETVMSMFDPSSVVSRWNSGETDDVNAELISVFHTAKEVSEASGGRYDVTVAPLVDLWGFGRKDVAEGFVPDSAEVALALQLIGMNRIEYVAPATLRRAKPGMQLDFSSIAKGYGVDRVTDALRSCGVENMMVEIGGEVMALGVNPKGQPWRIQIDAPVSGNPGDSALRVIELTDRAVATSGNYRNYRRRSDGSTFGHTLSPLTGYPVQTDMLSATVIAPRCELADALATACMTMNADEAAKMIRGFENVSAILVVDNGHGGYRVVEVSEL